MIVEIMFAAAVSFFAIILMLTNLERATVRKMVGHLGWVDLALHGSILFLFLGSSTLGLLQAELCGIGFSLFLRLYRWLNGCTRYETWVTLTLSDGRQWQGTEPQLVALELPIGAEVLNVQRKRRWVEHAGVMTR